MTLRDHIRVDGSVNHIVDHEIDKVGVKQVLAGQGYSESSCWHEAFHRRYMEYLSFQNMLLKKKAKRIHRKHFIS